MKKALTLTVVFLLVAALLCACELGSPTPTPEPTTMEHVHTAETLNNDESHHFWVCSCGEMMDQQEHTFSGDWVLVKGDGGCEDYTAYVKDCDGCHYQLYREEAPSGHEFVDFPMKEPTCSEDGYYPYTECTKCGMQSSHKEVWPATGNHSYNSDGKCTTCGVPAKGSAGLDLTLSADGTYYIVTNGDNCTAQHVYIPVEYNGKPVRVIGENAFSGNGTMQMVTMYGNVKTIEANAFMGAWKLQNVQFMEGLEYIGESAFARLEGDANLVIGGLPNSLKYIGDWAFMGTNIFDLDLPKNVSHVGEGAFDCMMLLNATCDPENKSYYSSGNCLIERSTGTLITTGYGSITVPDDGSVKKIATCAFSNVGGEVRDFYLPASVTYIEAYAFMHYGWEITVHFGGTREQWENMVTSGFISDNIEHFHVICADEEYAKGCGLAAPFFYSKKQPPISAAVLCA